MSFRRRLFFLFAVTVIVSVVAVAWIVSAMARRAFDRANDERTAALVAQFRKEFTRRGDDLSRRTEAAAVTAEANRMAVAAAQQAPDYSAFLDDAQSLAQSQGLDFLEFTDDRGTIISSAQSPAKFGYTEPLVSEHLPETPFLKQEETPSGSMLGLFAVRAVPAGDRKLIAIGGIRLDRTFLSTIALPAGMRVMIYEDADRSKDISASHLITTGDAVEDADPLTPLIREVQKNVREARSVIHWNNRPDEAVNAFPLTGEKDQLLGILLVGSSREIYGELTNQIRSAALIAAGAGLLLAVLLSSFAAARVTKPVEQLAEAAREVAAGNWTAHVTAQTNDELGVLADSFNRMTRDLLDHRERLVQAERVAAWRELARRLAHELKNPLFPLQLTVENLLRSREQGQEEFEETFRESASTLLGEIANLKSIISRFSEFSKMPQPHFQSVRIDQTLQDVVRVYQAQLQKCKIESRLELAAPDPIGADPELLHRALSNLVLNAIQAMPEGGKLVLRTSQSQEAVRIEVADTGKGLTPEESSRLFTPYYTSKSHGTGLGLAIVQSIISDHAGRISATSGPGRGATFIIELPCNQDKLSATEATHV
jgi:signal transduction histidine kinase